MPRCTYRFLMTPVDFRSLGAPPAAPIANHLLHLPTDQTISKKSSNVQKRLWQRIPKAQTLHLREAAAAQNHSISNAVRLRDSSSVCPNRLPAQGASEEVQAAYQGRSNTKVTFRKRSSCVCFAWFCSCKGGPTWMMAGQLLSRIQ